MVLTRTGVAFINIDFETLNSALRLPTNLNTLSCSIARSFLLCIKNVHFLNIDVLSMICYNLRNADKDWCDEVKFL